MRYESGEIVVDRDARQLLLRGQTVHVSAKAFDLLCLLIEKRPRALSKQEVHDQLWPDTYVGEASLPVVIREIRAALGESQRDVIRTVHRFGYAFNAPVREIATEAAAIPSRIHRLRHAAHEFELFEGENIVGRDPAVRVCIASGSVSRHHAVIAIDNEQATVRDLGSKNGTRIDGKPVEEATPLRDGSTVTFGAVQMTYHCYDPDSRTESLHR